VISIPDHPIGVKDNRFFVVSIATPAKEKEDNDGDKCNNASSNSASNRTSIAAASRTRWGIRHNDNRRLNSGGNYEAIGFC
jgi:hypothetical protein